MRPEVYVLAKWFSILVLNGIPIHFNAFDVFMCDCLEKDAHLWPFLVLAVHVDVGYAGEDLLSRDVVRQACQELSDVDEVHVCEDVLVKTQDTQCSAEEKFLTITTKHVPHTTRNVQWERFTVQGEDPTQTKTSDK